MPDIEKVYKGLLACTHSKIRRDCDHCPYNEEMNCDYVLWHGDLDALKEQAEEIQSLRKENNSILTQFYEWAKEQGKKTKELLQEIKDLRSTISPATAGEIITGEQHEGGEPE